MEKQQISTTALRTNQDRMDQTSPNSSNSQPEATVGVSFFSMFRFADKTDVLLMVLGTCGAIGLGAFTPLFVLFWGDMTNAFGSANDQIVDMAWQVLKKFIYLGCGGFLSGWLMITCWLISGERQASRCRKTYFAHLLKQEIGWFDCINQAELSSKFTSDTQCFQGAIGQKVAVMMQVFGAFLGGLIVAFIQGWLMALVCLAAIPLVAFSAFLFMRSTQTKAAEFEKFYSKAGGLSEQALYSIKTVKQLNGEAHEEKVYEDCLADVKADSIKFGVKIAASFGLMMGSMFLLYSLGYWFGGNCADPNNSSCPTSISGKLYSPGDVMTVFFAVMVGCFNLSQLSPAFKKIAQGQQAAARIFQILDREPKIVNPENGVKPTEFKGHIKLQNVTFAYPKEKSKVILNNLTIQFHVNNTALVGESGCGKSTILQLLMRFYDPDEGRILLDGIDLRDLDLVWLRNQIGYVGQEPVLFATSIKENLKLGYEHATDEEIINALKQAQAYDFVFHQLEEGLQTYVGSGGGQISGGQKQRIAIARALLKKPKILLLDEATSALDRRNEKLIQHTLNKVSQGLTTVTVAHRVQSIMNANIIYVINKGEIEEKGKFHQLNRYKDFDNKEADEREEEKIENQGKQVLKNPQENQKVAQIKEKTKEQIQKQETAQLVKKYQSGLYKRVFGYLKHQRLSFVFGILLTLVLGGTYPVFSIFLSDMINGLFLLQSPSTHDQGRKDIDTASLVFLLLAIGAFVVTFIRDLMTYVVGDEITNNIRRQAYNKMLKMPVYWFDKTSNNCGILSKRLGADCQTINGMATTYIYILLASITTCITALIIAFIYEWRITLIALGFMPVIVAAGAIKAAYKNGQTYKEDASLKDASQIVMETLTNIRTVVSFGVENTVLHKYSRYIDGPQAMLTKNGLISGFFFGFSQVTTFIIFGLLFYIGTIFVRDQGSSLLNVFTAIYEMFFAGITLGNNTHFMPDINEAKIAASHIFQILDAQDQEQIQKREESKMITQGMKGHIKLQNVSFKYQSRSQHVFKNINVEILPGQKVAFVGPSGCGKSTILQLLQRFYFPEAGKITIDGVDIKDFDVHYLRSRFGVVSQQPVLFNGTFRQNIKYNKYDATQEEIRRASAESNALSFIEGDEKMHNIETTTKETVEIEGHGFDRNVGIKGSHISGGQKQRVAIARAILRHPQILLLDEATSALDAQNEAKVQESLDRIMQRKTTITIAHRIETIKNSDTINVFEKGEIVERGTYDELLKMKGFFYNLERGTQFV